MFDFMFDAISTFHAFGFMFGGLIMIAIGGGLLAWWVSWRVRSVRVRGRIVGVKSTGERRTDEEWYEDYQDSAAVEADQKDFDELKADFVADFKKNPVKTSFMSVMMVVLAMVPFLFFGIGAWFAYDFLSIKAGGYKTTGTVSSYETTYDSDSGTMYYPVVSFKDNQGRGHSVKDRLGTGSEPYSRGEKVQVYYDPNDPERFVIDSFWRYMGFAFAFMGISSVFLVVMFLALFNILSDKELKGKPAQKRREIAKIKHNHYINQHYTPIYEFRGPGGEMIRAEGYDDATNWLADKLPGREVPLMVIRNKKTGEVNVKKPGKMLLVIGLIFLLPGMFLMKIAFSQLSWSLGSMAVVLGGIGFIAFKLRTALKDKADVIKEIKDDFKNFDLAEIRKIEVKKSPRAGYEMTPPEIRERLRALDRNTLIGVPFVLLFGIGIMVGGYALFKDMNNLSGKAMIAQGEVVDLRSRSDSDGGYTYYPVVEYHTISGETARFEGKTGSNPPMHKVGNRVMVLYDPERPSKAIIDHGIMNWLPSLGLMLLGALMVFHSLKWLVGIMGRARRVL
ncbi:MAG: DUF3592 domain-containing protein [Rhodospirillales bacterium]|nr:DUF3592 domain-containing protein [Rhodospirillales bacterium]MCB9995299.1 DUF3592 domain-containing protein [Rhodospirillales bacterium]